MRTREAGLENGSRVARITHLSDDKTVAKMGPPLCSETEGMGHPAARDQETAFVVSKVFLRKKRLWPGG
jgi:hypothetical protein